MSMAENTTRQVIQSQGGSMFPFIPGKSWLVVEPVGTAPLVPGDVVCFIGQDEQLVAHRVITVNGDSLSVRGDRGGGCEEVPTNAVFGRVLHVQRGPLRYRTAGVVGRVLAHVALRRPRLHRVLRHGAERLVQLRKWSGS